LENRGTNHQTSNEVIEVQVLP